MSMRAQTDSDHPQLIEVRGSTGATNQDWELPPPISLVGSEASVWERLPEKSVLVVGCGSVGGTLADAFARARVGRLVLVDPKRYKAASLATHCVSRADVGKLKALVTGARCKDANRNTRVSVFAGRVEELDLGAMAGIDLAVIAPDNLAAEIEAAQRCFWLGIPLLQASVHGPTLTAQLRFLRNTDPAGPCLACSYGRAEWEMLNQQTGFSCEGASGKPAAAVSAFRTNSLRALCAAARVSQ
jgi:molybdopterin/thiamine biosynthesis adenylyltransferase